jgi:hypothetical protein
MAACLAGCTHTQLRQSTVRQAGTVMDLHQQQVIDNLAMLCVNPYMVPHFAVAGSGTAQISDNGTMNGGLLFNPFENGDLGGTLGGAASRQVSEQWNLTAVVDPDKLEGIRCACLVALGSVPPSDSDCCDALKKVLEKDGIDAVSKLATSQWFGIANNRRTVPSSACFVGSYCDTFLWIDAIGMRQFAQLTQVILDIATLEDVYKVQQEKTTCFDWKQAKIVQITRTVPLKTRIATIERESKRWTDDAIINAASSSGVAPKTMSGMLKALVTNRPDHSLLQKLTRPDGLQDSVNELVEKRVGEAKRRLNGSDLQGTRHEIRAAILDLQYHRKALKDLSETNAEVLRTNRADEAVTKTAQIGENITLDAASIDTIIPRLEMADRTISEAIQVAEALGDRTRTQLHVPSQGLQFVPRR